MEINRKVNIMKKVLIIVIFVIVLIGFISLGMILSKNNKNYNFKIHFLAFIRIIFTAQKIRSELLELYIAAKILIKKYFFGIETQPI